MKIDDLERFSKYIRGTRIRADHHAEGVNEIIYVIFGLVAELSESFRVTDRENSRMGTIGGNICWVTKSDNSYAITYNHDIKKIEVRENSQQGKQIWVGDNNTPVAETINFFRRILSNES